VASRRRRPPTQRGRPMPTVGCLRPNRPTAIGRPLAKLLAHDETRIKPPISLPGRPAITESAKPPPPPKVLPPPQLDGQSALRRREAEPEDHKNAYSREQLLQMDARFTRRVERAFPTGGP